MVGICQRSRPSRHAFSKKMSSLHFLGREVDKGSYLAGQGPALELHGAYRTAVAEVFEQWDETPVFLSSFAELAGGILGAGTRIASIAMIPVLLARFGLRLELLDRRLRLGIPALLEPGARRRRRSGTRSLCPARAGVRPPLRPARLICLSSPRPELLGPGGALSWTLSCGAAGRRSL